MNLTTCDWEAVARALDAENARRRAGGVPETVPSCDADRRLAVYGSLAPGESNAFRLDHVGGTWSKGVVHGRLHDRGWGARLGFPGITLDADASAVAVDVLASDRLAEAWAALDAFEGDEYVRLLTLVFRDAAPVAVANIYELRQVR